jgi:hypothetical protein
MTQEERRKKFRSLMSLAARGLVVVLMALLAAFLFPAAQAKDKPEDNTRIYQHTYDEVFQASQEALERMGMFLDDKDKEKGTISGSGVYKGAEGPRHTIRIKFDVRTETVSTKPETRVTVNAKAKGGPFGGDGGWGKHFAQDYLSEVQQVLATYH